MSLGYSSRDSVYYSPEDSITTARLKIKFFNKFKSPFPLVNVTNMDVMLTIDAPVLVEQSLNSEIVLRKRDTS